MGKQQLAVALHTWLAERGLPLATIKRPRIRLEEQLSDELDERLDIARRHAVGGQGMRYRCEQNVLGAVLGLVAAASKEAVQTFVGLQPALGRDRQWRIRIVALATKADNGASSGLLRCPIHAGHLRRSRWGGVCWLFEHEENVGEQQAKASRIADLHRHVHEQLYCVLSGE